VGHTLAGASDGWASSQMYLRWPLGAPRRLLAITGETVPVSPYLTKYGERRKYGPLATRLLHYRGGMAGTATAPLLWESTARGGAIGLSGPCAPRRARAISLPGSGGDTEGVPER